ncbi:hypothetical protein QAD02_023285 [Eretmocerus hayati]|uniref:Uncharacterized protein n=1 Tax=Eretmocerus hayati TaxID=131215 RepID=A0ACC2PXI8_9HYME|nr:hypothetical protein QAD02_023285 [Eretmocerus hayati]
MEMDELSTASTRLILGADLVDQNFCNKKFDRTFNKDNKKNLSRIWLNFDRCTDRVNSSKRAQSNCEQNTRMANKLDEYSLLQIFESITDCQDKLNVQMVCKRWNAVCEQSWRSFQQLEVCEHCADEDGFIDMFLCKNILQRSYNYITKLNLSCTTHPKNDTLMDFDFHDKDTIYGHPCTSTVSQHYDIKPWMLNCCNIQQLTISSCVIQCDDAFLSELFRNNQKIRSVELIQLKLDGSCFRDLSYKHLESLILATCNITQINLESLDQIFVKIRCFSIRHSDIVRCNIEYALTPSLQQLDLTLPWIDEVNEVFEGDNTHQLALSTLETNSVILMNLTILILENSQLNDNLLSLISLRGYQLLALDISYCKNVTEEALQSLINLSKLKCLKMDGLSVSDDALENLSPNLKIISATSMYHVTEMGYYMAIEQLSSLLVIIIGNDFLRSESVNSLIQMLETEPDRVTPVEIILYRATFPREELVEIPPSIQITFENNLQCIDYSMYL